MLVSPFLISANLLYIPSSPPKSNLPEDELDCKSLCSFFTYCVAFCVFACTSTWIVPLLMVVLQYVQKGKCLAEQVFDFCLVFLFEFALLEHDLRFTAITDEANFFPHGVNVC